LNTGELARDVSGESVGARDERVAQGVAHRALEAGRSVVRLKARLAERSQVRLLRGSARVHLADAHASSAEERVHMGLRGRNEDGARISLRELRNGRTRWAHGGMRGTRG
jgi:hypothetical protein